MFLSSYKCHQITLSGEFSDPATTVAAAAQLVKSWFVFWRAEFNWSKVLSF